jgi:hypothetical protein
MVSSHARNTGLHTSKKPKGTPPMLMMGLSSKNLFPQIWTTELSTSCTCGLLRTRFVLEVSLVLPFLSLIRGRHRSHEELLREHRILKNLSKF